MKVIMSAGIILVLVLLAQCVSIDGIATENITQQLQADSSVALLGLFQYCLPVDKQYHNPFNFSEVNVMATIQTPSKTVTTDGFYYQNYTRAQSNGKEVLTTVGSPKWCIRYTPVSIETHMVSVMIKDKEGQRNIGKTTFDVKQNTSQSVSGFVTVAGDKVHFKDNHTNLLYVPNGENICWPSSKGTYDYDNYFTLLTSYGGNYARLWLTDSGWDDLAVQIANFNISLPNTWRLDYVVQLAEEAGMRLLMCTESFNCFSSVPKMPGFWDKNCYYNKKFGGILEKPEDFFTDEGARNDYKMRLRYLVSRYGYSVSVFAWEFFNEVDLTDHYNSDNQVAWIKEMSQYLRSIDVNKHLISTSFSHSDGDQKVQALPEMDFTMTHSYGASDILEQTARYAALKQKQYNKPSYIAEFGVADNSKADKYGVSLENGLWAPLFYMGAGTCMTWWWDSWVEPSSLYYLFDNVSQFIDNQLSYTSAVLQWEDIQKQVILSDSKLRVIGMGDASENRTVKMVLVNDPCYTWSNKNSLQCPKYQGKEITIQQCKDASAGYDVILYYGGTCKTMTDVKCQDGALKIDLPTFAHNMVVFARLK